MQAKNNATSPVSTPVAISVLLVGLSIGSLLVLAIGCAGDWGKHQFGPGDWLNDNTAMTVDTMYNYEWLNDPEIVIYKLDQMPINCGGVPAIGCALFVTGGDICVVFVGQTASPNIIEHELRHCRGWDHYDVPNSGWFPSSEMQRV